MSELVINNAVVHVLNKEQRGPLGEPDMRKTVLDSKHTAVHKLVQGIMAVYGKRQGNADYGVFETGFSRRQFCDDFEAYAKIKDPSDDDFMAVSISAMKELCQAAGDEDLASGGYIVFVDYSTPQGRYFVTAMLKPRPGIMIRGLNPEELEHLDLDKLAQAARISFSRLNEYFTADELEKQEINYLSFVSPSRTKKSAGYFVSALGCKRGATSARATETIIKQSKALFRGRPELKPYAQKVKESVVDFLNERVREKPVTLTEIGQVIQKHIPTTMAEEAEDFVKEFLDRLNSDEFGVPFEFSANGPVVHRHTYIEGKSAYWKASIDRHGLGEKDDAEIHYQRETGRLIFNNVPDKMRRQLEEELDAKIEADNQAKQKASGKVEKEIPESGH